MFFFAFSCIPLQFEVDGTTATMTGDLTSSAPRKVRRLLETYPELTLIKLLDCPGSLNDDAAFEAARMIREANINTHVPANGEIASGAVDFFIAGIERTIEEGALIGVHSWGAAGADGDSLPEDDPEHQFYLSYYEEMGISADFYWFTLEAAGPNDIHWMTEEELLLYGLLTD